MVNWNENKNNQTFCNSSKSSAALARERRVGTISETIRRRRRRIVGLNSTATQQRGTGRQLSWDDAADAWKNRARWNEKVGAVKNANCNDETKQLYEESTKWRYGRCQLFPPRGLNKRMRGIENSSLARTGCNRCPL